MRYRSLLLLLLVMALVMVACSSGGSASPTEEPAATQGSEAAQPTEEMAQEPAAEQVEVFSWWTGGGEAAGLEAMVKIFGEEYPNVEFINAAVAGGAGTNARAVLATRLQAGDAPDSWQGHAGQELIGTYVAAGQIEPLNDLYDENGWLDVMPETLSPSSPRTATFTLCRLIFTGRTCSGTTPAFWKRMALTCRLTWTSGLRRWTR